MHVWNLWGSVPLTRLRTTALDGKGSGEKPNFSGEGSVRQGFHAKNL